MPSSLAVLWTSYFTTIKTVTFSYNNTNGTFDRLTITNIQDKMYPNKTGMPLWGVGNSGNAYSMGDTNLIWGQVCDEYAEDITVSTVRQPSLYLPAFLSTLASDLGGAYGNWENLPGSDFSVGALSTAYSVGHSSLSVALGSSSTAGNVDYTGKSSLAMWARWQNLTSQAATASLIPNFDFHGLCIVGVVGTKGILGPGNVALKNLVPISVTPMRSVVRYHLPYAIPASLCAFMLLANMLGAPVSMCISRRGIAGSRRHLQDLSPGCIYTVFLFSGEASLGIKGKEWNKKFGTRIISLSADFPWSGVTVNTALSNMEQSVVHEYECAAYT